MAGFAFTNSPAFSNDPQKAGQYEPNVAQPHGQAQQPYGQQQFGQQQQFGHQPYGQAPSQGGPVQGGPLQGGPFHGSPEQLGQMYDRPSATVTDTNRMSFDGVIMKTVATLALVALGFVIQLGLFFAGQGQLMQILTIGGGIAGFIVAMVNIFKRTPSPALVLVYGFLEGLLVGGLSVIVEWGMNLPGIIFQALLATACVFAVTLALYAFRIIRVTPKFTRFFIIAIVAYGLFSLVNFGLMLFGAVDDPWGMRSWEIIPGVPLGVILGILAVGLGAYSLMIDFNNVETGVKRGAPRVFEWQAAFGITATIIWLYVEILRLIAILRR